MKFAKKIDAAKAMTDSNLKLSKLQTLALQAVPHSSTQPIPPLLLRSFARTRLQAPTTFM